MTDTPVSQPNGPDSLVLALSKGRILDETLPLLAAAGIEPVDDLGASRKLMVETTRPGVRLLVLRAQDVPTFVDRGAADLGVAGKDVLLEHEGGGLYEPLDLGIARCRLMVARPRGESREWQGGNRRPRVATKYVKTARQFFADQGQQVDTIKLYGSMEIAPAMGLADWIVDVVDTGSTLKANGLEAHELIADVSSRLIANRASMKMKHAPMRAFVQALQGAVKARG